MPTGTAKRILDDITSFIFLEDEPIKADIILIPGSASPQPAERAAELYRAGWAKLILPSGKFSYKRQRFEGPVELRDRYAGPYETEWEFLRDVLIKNGAPENAVLREDQSTHTVDNAIFSRQVLDGSGLAVHSALLCCRAYHARRCLMTFGWAFPGVEFAVCPVETHGIGRGNWHKTAEGREKVMSEVSKCGSYFKDIAALWSEEE
jgi:uncharacterized SAM-binding protein YcdF (DUF218 family)